MRYAKRYNYLCSQARVDDDLVIYEAFTFSSGVDKHLQIRFRRHTHGLILRQRKLGKMSKKEQQEAEAAASKRVCHLRPFTDISGYSGVSTDRKS